MKNPYPHKNGEAVLKKKKDVGIIHLSSKKEKKKNKKKMLGNAREG